ncbi:hypothetical protein OROGR_003431 [Orobanche gracilis]
MTTAIPPLHQLLTFRFTAALLISTVIWETRRQGKKLNTEGRKAYAEEKYGKMDELVLKHETHGGIKHLSFVSRPHMSPKETISLPFYEADDEIGGNCCRGMFYFDNFEGKAVVCNLTTKECKLLTPPNEDAFFCNSDLGYDPKSDDYKVIRNHCPSSTAEVYSLKNNSWKVISGSGNDINMGPECGVYLGGKCYWIVWMYTPEYDGVQDFILSFDFTNESFAQLPLPLPLRPEDQDHVRDFKIDLFDCNGLLSVVGFKSVEDYETRVAKHFELWVYENGVWARSFSAILVDVERPFGVKDGRFLFLEGNSSCKHNHLMVYDWIKEELREHRFYDVQPSQMLVFSYVENTTMLPDAKPLINGYKSFIYFFAVFILVIFMIAHLYAYENRSAQNDDEDSSGNVFRRCRRRDKVPKKYRPKCTRC